MYLSIYLSIYLSTWLEAGEAVVREVEVLEGPEPREAVQAEEAVPAQHQPTQARHLDR